MRRSLLPAVLFCLMAWPVFAETWAGFLVDAKCYASEERAVNPFDPTFDTNHDRGYEVRVCRPSEKTKSFIVVEGDGTSFDLDAAGNDKAAHLLNEAGHSVIIRVNVTGRKRGHIVAVDSISITK